MSKRNFGFAVRAFLQAGGESARRSGSRIERTGIEREHVVLPGTGRASFRAPIRQTERRAWFASLALVLWLTACRGGDRPPPPSPVPETPTSGWVACGDLRCQHFADAASALRVVMSTEPRVIAFGESHALRGAEPVVSATERFGADWLPLLKNAGARALVVELISPPSGCEADKAAVREVQKPVVERQDAENQTRFVQLGHRARALGILPLVLEPTCDEFSVVRQAGADGVSALLELITRQTRGKLERLAARAAPGELVVAYGGALHNDLDRPGEQKPFAFGSALEGALGGRYVAVDLVVPEFVGTTEAWRSLPWYGIWPSVPKEGITLVETSPHEYALFLERGVTRLSGAPLPSAATTLQ